MTVKSKRGAVRRYRALVNAYRRLYAGGGSFGFDWATLRLNAPETYAEIQALRAAYASLPD
jgi:hypothetical protein